MNPIGPDATFRTAEIQAATSIASSTIKDNVSGGTQPQGRHERVYWKAAVSLARGRLSEWRLEPPQEPSACLGTYLERVKARHAVTADDFVAALAQLRDLKTERLGVVEEVADRATDPEGRRPRSTQSTRRQERSRLRA